MGLLQLFNLADTKAMVHGATAGSVGMEYEVPAFSQGDTPSIEYTLLRSNGIRLEPTKTAPGSYSLSIGLYTNDATSTQLAFQSTWTDDVANSRKTGTLVFNSSNVSTAIGSAASITVRLVVMVTISGLDQTVYDREVTLKRRRIPSPTTTVPENETAATVSWVDQTFAPLVGCMGIVFTDPNTGETAMYGFRDGDFKRIQ